MEWHALVQSLDIVKTKYKSDCEYYLDNSYNFTQTSASVLLFFCGAESCLVLKFPAICSIIVYLRED